MGRLELENISSQVLILQQINHSPTSLSVVAETMKRSIEVATGGRRNNIAVTYNLTIAKLARQIQLEETLIYDSLFIAMGPFHIEMAFFSAIGKIVDESGGPHILNECDVLAKGSLRSFYKGKNYKRCKRIHETLSLALQVLHFEAFLGSIENTAELVEVVRYGTTKIEDETSVDFRYSKEMEEIFSNYHIYCKKTENGIHGKTPQFWMQYINLIHFYHDFTRSIRNGDLHLYISCFPKLPNCFFALNHPNYAIWCVKYYDSLIKLPETHPDVYNDFKKGWFGMKRTKKSFSSTPIGLTLEQTINADAASQRLGISLITK